MKRWVYAARLRTLPLASASVILGGAIAVASGHFRLSVTILALSTTLLLQILANLANDYGDAVTGVDNDKRVGPNRAVQSGMITRKGMLYGIFVTTGLSSVSGVALLLVSTWGYYKIMAAFAILGLTAIAAAIRYTVGKKPYGYYGFGDLFVFLFFGIVGVYGTYYLNTLNPDLNVLLPASALGLLSVGVLNLNNMRDHVQDIHSGKHTLASRMGFKIAKLYQTALVVGSVLLFEIFSSIFDINWTQKLYWVTAVLLIFHIYKVIKTENPADLDPQLKFLSISTFIFTVIYALSILWKI